MSLHAQLSPEALARLHAQQRNSTISSIVIAILVILLVGIILLYMFLDPIDNFTPEIVSYQANTEENDNVKKREMTRAVERKPAAPSSSMAKVIAANTVSNTAIPVPEIDVPDPSTDFGDGDDFGDGWGDGDGGSGGGFGAIPQTMRERCSKADRLNRLAKNGGNEQCEEAVVKGLRWLKETQNADGSWCGEHRIAMTGFAILAYLGHCETPNSEEFGDSITRGIVFLINVSMKNGGKMSSDYKDKYWPYEHGIATYALGESATFCGKLGINIPNLNEATKMSGDVILKSQHNTGSWVYHYKKSGGKLNGDNSLGFWQIQALKACKHSGLWEDGAFSRASRKALAYIRSSQDSDGGIGYEKKRRIVDHSTLTGGGMLAFQMWGKSHDSVVRRGAKYLRKNARLDYNSHDANLYGSYYDAQAMINRGGEDWEFYNNLFRDQILKNQNDNGSWKDPGGGSHAKHWHYGGNGAKEVHYRTCLCIFMLEVYYRFLPATGSKTR